MTFTFDNLPHWGCNECGYGWPCCAFCPNDKPLCCAACRSPSWDGPILSDDPGSELPGA